MEENFSVFSRKGSGNTKPELVAHFETWGWINFLSSIAETKVFDVPGSGLDSIESAKKAKAFKVLTFASEKKEYGLAYEESYKN